MHRLYTAPGAVHNLPSRASRAATLAAEGYQGPFAMSYMTTLNISVPSDTLMFMDAMPSIAEGAPRNCCILCCLQQEFVTTLEQRAAWLQTVYMCTLERFRQAGHSAWC